MVCGHGGCRECAGGGADVLRARRGGAGREDAGVVCQCVSAVLESSGQQHPYLPALLEYESVHSRVICSSHGRVSDALLL